jgi:hypothetical protein
MAGKTLVTEFFTKVKKRLTSPEELAHSVPEAFTNHVGVFDELIQGEDVIGVLLGEELTDRHLDRGDRLIDAVDVNSDRVLAIEKVNNLRKGSGWAEWGLLTPEQDGTRRGPSWGTHSTGRSCHHSIEGWKP